MEAKKQSRFLIGFIVLFSVQIDFIPQRIQFQFVVHGDLPDFGNIEGSKSGTAAYQNRLGSLAGTQLELLVLPNSEVIRVFDFQIFKENIHIVLEILVVLPDFKGVDELKQCGEVLFLHGSLVVNIADDGGIQQGFRLWE